MAQLRLPVRGTPFDRSNPGFVAGANPANVALLAMLEPTRRMRHADTQSRPPIGGKRWPVR